LITQSLQLFIVIQLSRNIFFQFRHRVAGSAKSSLPGVLQEIATGLRANHKEAIFNLLV